MGTKPKTSRLKQKCARCGKMTKVKNMKPCLDCDQNKLLCPECDAEDDEYGGYGCFSCFARKDAEHDEEIYPFVAGERL